MLYTRTSTPSIETQVNASMYHTILSLLFMLVQRYKITSHMCNNRVYRLVKPLNAFGNSSKDNLPFALHTLSI